ncbi:MAG: hypothetical protein P8X90_31730, partial [Desulfobacterales bacterium]
VRRDTGRCHSIELVPKAQPIGIRHGFADFFQRLYMLGLVWAFKSYKVNRSLKEMMQGRLWVSRRKLITDYGGTGKLRPSGDSRLVPGPSVTGSR